MIHVKFCWHCGRRLRGNHHIELMIHGYMRTLHKSCVDGWKSRHDQDSIPDEIMSPRYRDTSAEIILQENDG